MAKVATVFIPGVMGTRLRMPSAGVKWDPDNVWSMKRWILWSAETTRVWLHTGLTSAYVMNEYRNHLSRSEVQRGWSALPTDFYHPTTLRLIEANGCAAPLFVLGYDWRQDLMSLGSWAAAELRRIKTRAGADGGLVLLTHSMGGLVARAALRSDSNLESEGVVNSAIHVMQPGVGTPLAYRRFLTGSIEDVWKDPFNKLLYLILGLSRESYALNMSGAPGPCQLLPSDEYRDTTLSSTGSPEWWIEGQVMAAVESIYPLGSPPGIIPMRLRQEIKDELQKRLSEVFSFQRWISGTHFSNTWAIVGTGFDTEARTCVPNAGRPYGIIARRKGDATVALDSAKATGGYGSGRLAEVVAEHGTPYSRQNATNSAIVTKTIEFLREAMSCVNPSSRDV